MKIEEFIGTAKYDRDGQVIFAVDKEGGHQLILDVRGWGHIQHLFPMTPEGQEQAGAFQDELGQWITDAINEKITLPKKNEPVECTCISPEDFYNCTVENCFVKNNNS